MKHYILFFLLFIGTSIEAQVVINEFSAANYNDVTDNFGDNSDWIELFNASSSPIDLEGYFLSDRATNPTKWVFPAGVTMQGNGYLRIWASKKDEVVGNNIHTNFKLTQTKDNEVIVFSDPDTLIIDSRDLEPNQEGHSRGRITDASNDWGVFTNPTPNSSNNSAKEEYAAAPIFSSPAGFYNGLVSVALSSPESDATIYYTTNGDTPNSSDTQYTGPIDITETTVLRAIAYLPSSTNAPESFAITNTYFVDENHGVYVVSIAGDDIMDLLNGDQFEPQGTIELFDEGNGERLAFSTGEFNKHGNDSWAYDQRGLDYISRDQFGTKYALEYPIFSNKDRDDYQRIMLKAAASDNYPFEDGGCHIRDAYVQELSQRGDLRLDERSYEACVMYVNGEYWGVYEIREKVDDADFTDHYYDQDHPNIQYIKTWGGTWSEFGGPQSITDWNNLRTFITSNDMADTSNYNYVKSQLNTGSLIDYIILNTQIVNADWLNWNTSWWRGLDPEGSKKKWRYSLWDMDASFGHYVNFTGIPDQSANADPCDNEEVGGSDFEGHTEMLTALYDNPDFYDDYINRWAGLNSTVFSCDNMIGLLNELITKIQPEMDRHFDRWGGTEAEWIDNILELRQFIQARCTVIDEGIVDCYEVDGPYELVVDVSPPNSGRVEVNSITPEIYPFVGEYYGGVEIELGANPDEAWEFDHWEIKNQTLLPDTLSENVSFDFTVGDTVIAFFRPIGIAINLDFNFPNTDGVVVINDSITTEEAWTGIFQVGDTLFLSIEGGNEGYEFANWAYTETDSNFLGPTISDEEVYFVVQTNDSITVNFDPIPYEVTIITEGNGMVALDNDVLPDTWTDTFFFGDVLDLVATADTYNEFEQWITNNSTVSAPFNPISSITLSGADTIYVNFIEQTGEMIVDIGSGLGGSVAVNNVPIIDSPTIISEPLGTNLNVVATPDDGYAFVEWQLSDNTIVVDLTAETIDFIFENDLELTAIFELLPVNITIVLDDVLQNGGEFTVNGNAVTNNTYTEEISVGTVFNLDATSYTGFVFDQWISANSSMTDPTNSSVTYTSTTNDTIYVVFAPEIATVNLNMGDAGGGNVAVNGTDVTAYPWTTEASLGTDFAFSATPEDGYTFVKWELSDSTIVPDVTAENLNFALSNNLDITAIFELLPVTVTVVLDDATLAESGLVNINGELLEDGNYSIEVPIGTLFELEAIANDGFVFDGWLVNGELVESDRLDWEAIWGGGIISLSFSEEFKECFVNVPTAFAPNGSGQNRTFAPVINTGCEMQNYNMKIFNRWGNLVFATSDPSFAWDGYDNKEATELGTYMWFLEYEIKDIDGQMKKVEDRGDLLLLR